MKHLKNFNESNRPFEYKGTEEEEQLEIKKIVDTIHDIFIEQEDEGAIVVVKENCLPDKIDDMESLMKTGILVKLYPKDSIEYSKLSDSVNMLIDFMKSKWGNVGVKYYFDYMIDGFMGKDIVRNERSYNKQPKNDLLISEMKILITKKGENYITRLIRGEIERIKNF
jgi:hypothetical protein